MNRNRYSGIFFIAVAIICVTMCNVYAQYADSMHEAQRESYFDEDGTLRSIVVTNDDGSSVTKKFDKTGQISEKLFSDTKKIVYEFELENDIKIARETWYPDNTTIKRVFNNRGEIVKSVYPDREEEYTYSYNQVGDVVLVTVKRGGESIELDPHDEYLSFFDDYGVLDDGEQDIEKDMIERPYLFNPRQYRETIKNMQQNR